LPSIFTDPALAPYLTGSSLAVLWAGAFVGALAAGGAGFAFGIVAASIWLHAIEPVYTTFLVVSCGTILHSGLIWQVRRHIEPSRLWPFLAGGVIGIPIGVWLLTRGNADLIKSALGLFLIAYGIYALAAPRLPVIHHGGKAADGLVGLGGGVLGGIGGFSGVLPAIWTQLRGWPKEAARGVYQPFILFGHISALILVGIVAFNRVGAVLLALAIPPLLAGAWVGWHIYGRLDERRFRQVLAALLVVSGAALVL
jgi:uncharacterized membrane protein YfcA